MRRGHTSASLEEAADSFYTSRADGAMQRRRASLVLVLDVRARANEELDHRALLRRIPRRGIGPGIARVVQRDGASPIRRVRVGASVDQRLDDERPESSGREVKRRVSGVQTGAARPSPDVR